MPSSAHQLRCQDHIRIRSKSELHQRVFWNSLSQSKGNTQHLSCLIKPNFSEVPGELGLAVAKGPSCRAHTESRRNPGDVFIFVELWPQLSKKSNGGAAIRETSKC
mmetsp:Transcript_92712/g.135499  ORF Transcript_92712/g.135499 Transcript_92712/m.135499 type:complete len:106 (+) Transcript_92712:488-805(+)